VTCKFTELNQEKTGDILKPDIYLFINVTSPRVHHLLVSRFFGAEKDVRKVLRVERLCEQLIIFLLCANKISNIKITSYGFVLFRESKNERRKTKKIKILTLSLPTLK
jgi:hypothetical protein